MFGEMQHYGNSVGQFNLFRPARISPASTLNTSDNVNFLQFIRDEEVYPRYEPPDSNMPSLVDFLFNEAFSGHPSSQQAYVERMREVTFVYEEAIILYCVLFAVLLLLFFTKELFAFCVIRRSKISVEEVFASQFDRISRTLCRKMEVEYDMAYSGDHALLGVIVDDRGIARASPIASSASKSSFPDT